MKRSRILGRNAADLIGLDGLASTASFAGSEPLMETRLGIDIGGTFTDLVFLNSEGRVLRAKVLSTPDDYSLGIAAGLESHRRQRRRADRLRSRRSCTATTVATNAHSRRQGRARRA